MTFISSISRIDVQKEESSSLSLSKPTQRFLELLLKHKIKLFYYMQNESI